MRTNSITSCFPKKVLKSVTDQRISGLSPPQTKVMFWHVCLFPGGSLSLCPGDLPRTVRTLLYRRTSYWNAFLYLVNVLSKTAWKLKQINWGGAEAGGGVPDIPTSLIETIGTYSNIPAHFFSSSRGSKGWIVFFKKFLQDMSPFYGATDAPVLDFWWRLLWVSKPERAALFELSRGICVTLHVPWDSPLLRHLPTSWQPAWQLSHLFHIPARHWWDSKPGAIMPPLTVWDQADALPTELSRLGSRTG